MYRLVAFFLLLLFLAIPSLAQYDSSDITRAEYGTTTQFADVTERVRSLAANTPRFRVDDDTLGVYSRADGAKTLRVFVRDRYGNSNQLTFRQNEYADLSNVSGNSGTYGSSGQYNQGSLQITSARYGAGYDSADVTDRLNSRIQNGRLEMRVGSDTLGGDPAPGRGKYLTVHYTYNGRQAQAVLRDGDNLQLPEPTGTTPQSTYPNSGLEIMRATYGTWNRTVDVTSRLRSQVRNGELDIQVNSAALGADPAPGQSKTLNVEYRSNGQQLQASARDGATLHLSADNLSGSRRGRGSRNTQTIVCESTGAGRNYCAADTRGGVQLSRQMGNAECRQGSTWGYDDQAIWVSNGCRAEFRVTSASGANASVAGPSMTIASGTQLSVRTNQNIDSSQASVGQTFDAEIAQDILDNSGGVAIPKASPVQLVIRNAEGSDLVLDVDSITVGGRRYAVSTSDLEKKGGSGIGANKRTATMVGGGAVAGAIIGAIAGGGKGAAIGAVLGGAGGAGVQVLTKGKEVKVPAETVLTFQLDSDLRLEQTRY